MGGSAAQQNLPGLTLIFLPLFLVVSVGSCILIGKMTGCRGQLCCNDSCCCAEGFWEVMFDGSLTTGMAREASVVSLQDMENTSEVVGPPVMLAPPPQPALAGGLETTD